MIKQILILGVLFLSCSSADVEGQFLFSKSTVKSNENLIVDFSREKALNRLKSKNQKKEDLVVHVFVPLCDNEHQGIVPVSKTLGDGFSTKTNLYWGALYGIKTHFKKAKKWKQLNTTVNPNINILERVVFKYSKSNGQSIYLIADAYRGDKMEQCLTDFFNAISGNAKKIIVIGNSHIGEASNADFILFNGHNGLMDVSVSKITNTDGVIRDAGVIGCVSYNYFKNHLREAKAYPLLTTTNFMAPEAYVLEGAINSWAKAKSGEEIRKNVGVHYHKYQKCGLKGATKLFKTGW